MNGLRLWGGFTMKGQTILILAVLLLSISAIVLSINHHFNVLSYLEEEYSDTESRLSVLKKEWETVTFERWMLVELGTYPRNASSLNAADIIKTFVFYSNNVSEENSTLRFDALSENFNITVAYLELTNQTNVDKLEQICNKTGFPQPDPWQSYVILLNSSKIICLRLEQTTDEVFSKCVEYLRGSVPET